MTSLSTKIADLRDLVTLPSSFSPLASGPSRKPPLSPRSPLPDHQQLSPGSGHLSTNARCFGRTASAPASSAFFTTFQAQSQGSNRVSSGLGTNNGLLASPTLTETSEEDATAPDDVPLEGRTLLASPSLPVPSVTKPMASEVRSRSFGRSRTGAVNLSPSVGTGFGRTAAMDICILAGSNALTS